MGYASYLEDIRDRLIEQLHQLDQSMENAEFKATRSFARCMAIKDTARQLLAECDKILDHATDPRIEASLEAFVANYKARDAAQDHKHTQAELSRAKADNTNLRAQLAQRDRVIAGLESKVAEIKLKYEDFNRRATTQPEVFNRLIENSLRKNDAQMRRGKK